MARALLAQADLARAILAQAILAPAGKSHTGTAGKYHTGTAGKSHTGTAGKSWPELIPKIVFLTFSVFLGGPGPFLARALLAQADLARAVLGSSHLARPFLAVAFLAQAIPVRETYGSLRCRFKIRLAFRDLGLVPGWHFAARGRWSLGPLPLSCSSFWLKPFPAPGPPCPATLPTQARESLAKVRVDQVAQAFGGGTRHQDLIKQASAC